MRITELSGSIAGVLLLLSDIPDIKQNLSSFIFNSLNVTFSTQGLVANSCEHRDELGIS
jgi:hypothetical protein